MSARNDGGPAFPVDEIALNRGEVCAQYFGVTVRDYFAAKAMQGMLAHGDLGSLKIPEAAELAYLVADRMLIAREAKS